MPRVSSLADVDVELLTRLLKDGRIKSFTTELHSSDGVYEIHKILAQFAEKDKPAAALLLKSSTERHSWRSNEYLDSRSGREAHFYSKLGTGLPQFALLDPCHVSYDRSNRATTLLLLSHPLSMKGNTKKGLGLAQARFAVSEIARLQAAAIRYCASDHPWLQQSSTSLNPEKLKATIRLLQSAGHLGSPHVEICTKTVESISAYNEWSTTRSASGMIHGDYTASNLLFTSKRGVPPISILNWEHVHWGPLLVDVAFLIGSSLTRENRQQWTKELIQLWFTWFTFLAPDGSDIVLSLEEATTQYRAHSLYGVLHTLSKLDGQSEDDVDLEVLRRCCDQIQDLKAFEMISQSAGSTSKL